MNILGKGGASSDDSGRSRRFEAQGMGAVGTLLVMVAIGFKCYRSYQRYQFREDRRRETEERINAGFAASQERMEAMRRESSERIAAQQRRHDERMQASIERSNAMANQLLAGERPVSAWSGTAPANQPPAAAPPAPQSRAPQPSAAPRAVTAAPSKPAEAVPAKPLPPPKPAFVDPAMVTSLPVARPVRQLQFGSRDDRPTLLDGRGVRVLALEQKRVLRDFSGDMISVARDGCVATKMLAVRDAQVWNPESGAQLARLPVGEEIDRLVLARDGQYLLAIGETIRGWNVPTQKGTTAFAGLADLKCGRVTAAALSDDGTRAALVAPPMLVVWDVASDKLSIRVPVETSPADDVQFGVTADRLYWRHGEQVDAWQLSEPRRLWQTAKHGQIVASHAQGELLVTATTGSALHLWRLADGQPAGKEHACEASLSDVRIAPSNRYVLGALPDKIGVWEIARLTAN